jgi:membrane dipeptidase
MKAGDSSVETRHALYDFHLSDADEARAKRLHRDSIVLDLLSQHAGGNIFSHYPPALRSAFEAQTATVTGYEDLVDVIYWPYEMSRLGRSDLIMNWLQIGGLTCGTHSIDVHDGKDALLNKWDSVVMRYGNLPWLRYVTTAAEIRRAKRDGVIASYAHCQPTTPVPRNLNLFDVAYAKGLRSFMLTYNQMDNIGVGCTERVDAGLSKYGVEVVRHCNEIGMMVDVSHCGHLTTIDACRHSRKPVNANHTSARSLSFHARGKTDEDLRAIADTGGVVGVVALPIFLSRQPAASIEDMLDHIEYIADLIGWHHVAIGTDSPQPAPDDVLVRVLAPELKQIGFHDEDELDVTKRLIGFDDCRDLPNITRGLVGRGCSDEQIQGILGENALRVFAEVCG